MSDEKLRGAMGFAMRSGNCIAGDFACEKAVKSGKAKLIMLDASASESTRDRYGGMCSRAGIKCLVIENMASAIGKYGRMVAAITDSGFSRMICEAYENIHGGVD